METCTRHQALETLRAAIADVKPGAGAAESILANLSLQGWSVVPSLLAEAQERDAADYAAEQDDPRTILEEAQAAVYGDRQEDYGHPREDFTRTAIIWTGLLQHKLADGAYVEAEDIARCMVGVKLSRDVHTAKRDNRVDGAGYFLTLDRLATGR